MLERINVNEYIATHKNDNNVTYEKKQGKDHAAFVSADKENIMAPKHKKRRGGESLTNYFKMVTDFLIPDF